MEPKFNLWKFIQMIILSHWVIEQMDLLYSGKPPFKAKYSQSRCYSKTLENCYNSVCF